MNIVELLFGTGSILRENVSGLATEPGSTANVYPDHPPLDLSKDAYPRATVDTIGNSPLLSSVLKGAFSGTTLLDITVYAVNSKQMNQILGDSVDAVLDNYSGTDSNGDPYYTEWEPVEPRNVGPVFDDEIAAGFTRYSKTAEIAFTYMSGSGDNITIGDTEIAVITDVESTQEVPNSEIKDVSELPPAITTHQPDNERLSISFALSEQFHSTGDSIEDQKNAVSDLADTDPPDNRIDFLSWDGWLGVTNVQFTRTQEDYQEGIIEGIYLPLDEYQSHDDFTV